MNTHSPSPALISVVIPTYNRARYVREAIDSVLMQDYPHFEVVVVDDGSTDATPEIIESYGQRVRFIRQANSGPSAARNHGVREAKGELIAFHDSDDIMLPGRLSAQAQLFARNPRLGLASGEYRKIGADGQELGHVTLSVFDRLCLATGTLYRNFFSTTTVMVRRSCFDTAGYFAHDLFFGEDWDLWLRIMNSYDFKHLAKPVACMRFHDASIVGSLSKENFEQWQMVIDRAFKRQTDSGHPQARAQSLRRKRLSFMLFNQAWAIASNDVAKARQTTIESIKLWPWWGLRRYSALIISFLKAGVKRYA